MRGLIGNDAAFWGANANIYTHILIILPFN